MAFDLDGRRVDDLRASAAGHGFVTAVAERDGTLVASSLHEDDVVSPGEAGRLTPVKTASRYPHPAPGGRQDDGVSGTGRLMLGGADPWSGHAAHTEAVVRRAAAVE